MQMYVLHLNAIKGIARRFVTAKNEQYEQYERYPRPVARTAAGSDERRQGTGRESAAVGNAADAGRCKWQP